MISKQAALEGLQLLAKQERLFEVHLSGVSMSPTIPDGVSIRVDSASKAVPGDVVVFRDGDKLVAHRLRSVARGQMILLGDGNVMPDLPIAVDRALGCVVEWLDGDRWRSVGPRLRESAWTRTAVFFASIALRVSPFLARKTVAVFNLLTRLLRN